jgi:hypothetical protein
MPRTIDELIIELRDLEAEIQAVYDKKRERVHFVIENGRVRFSEAVTEQQRLRKISLPTYITHAHPLNILVSPVIYLGWIPLGMLDLFVSFYQAICFPTYGITKVKRSEYVVLDRGDLPYLNVVQKFNCFYCGYANGVVAYAREIAARTEQYWCPIKHSRRILAAHERYPRFFEYGDAEAFRAGLKHLQRELRLADEE